jgi:hypothetical protein
MKVVIFIGDAQHLTLTYEITPRKERPCVIESLFLSQPPHSAFLALLPMPQLGLGASILGASIKQAFFAQPTSCTAVASTNLSCK